MGVPSLGNELVTQKHVRAFFQPGGPGGNNRALYSGQDMSYIRVEGASQPQLGGVDPMFVHDPNRIGAYKNVATMISTPDLPSATVVLTEKRGGIPRQFTKLGCTFNLYEMVGQCKDLSDFNAGWSDYVLIYPGAVVTGKDFGDRTTFEDDGVLEASLDVTFAREIYAAGPLNMGISGPSLTGKVARDVTYGGGVSCSNCGDDNDGTQWLYAAGEGAAAAKPDLHYSINGGGTWTTVNIAAAAVDEDIVAIAVAGSRLIMVSRLAAVGSAFYISDINPITGVPSTPVKVNTGFVLAGMVNDMLVISPTEIYLVGDGGYIYKTTDPASGVTVLNAGVATTANLQRIDGNSEILVASGATQSLLYSTSKGVAWSSSTTVPGAAATYQALSVNARNHWWIGTSLGEVWYTRNGGESWAQKLLNADTNAAIDDIVFATPEVGYIAARTATPTARLYATVDGGYTWARTAPRVSGLSTFNKANRIAIPYAADLTLQANRVALAGTAGVATDGYIAIGASAIV